MERVQVENYQHLRQRTLTQPAIGSISDKKKNSLNYFFFFNSRIDLKTFKENNRQKYFCFPVILFNSAINWLRNV